MLFIDEIHRLNAAVEEILYPALEDFRLDIVIGQGAGRADADARPAAVHARRRDDADRAADDAAARPLRDDVPARLLRARTSSRRSCAARPRILGVEIDARGRATRSRGARAGRRASRTGSCAASATSPRCATRATSRPTIAREALELLEVDEEGLERTDRELLARDRRQVRRRAGRPLHARGRARRGARHDRGRLRAVPAPARVHPADAARADRHRRSAASTSARRPAAGRAPLLSGPELWVAGRGGAAATSSSAKPRRSRRSPRHGSRTSPSRSSSRDGARYDLISISRRAGFGFVTLRPHPEDRSRRRSSSRSGRSRGSGSARRTRGRVPGSCCRPSRALPRRRSGSGVGCEKKFQRRHIRRGDPAVGSASEGGGSEPHPMGGTAVRTVRWDASNSPAERTRRSGAAARERAG